MLVGLSLEDMDRLFMRSTCKTVWQALVQRRSVQDVLEERRAAAPVFGGEKKETYLEQVESVDLRRSCT